MKKNLIIFLCGVLSIFVTPPVFAVDESIKNAGFVPTNIWYSQESFFAGDKVRIYTVIFNGSTEDLVGTVEFLSNGVSVGTTDFSLAGGGRARDVWVDWTAEEGKHVIAARIAEVSVVGKNGKKRLITLANAETGKSERTIDFDTDGDNIGNINDLDDDNDSIPDIDEIRNGTDPLKKDTDGDGTGDAEELAQKDIAVKESTTTQNIGIVENALKTIDEKIPEPLSEAVSSGMNIVERFRIGEGYQFRLAKEEKEKEISALGTRANLLAGTKKVSQEEVRMMEKAGEVTEKPFAYISFAVLALLQYFFEWKIIFYGVSLYILYRLVKWVIGKIRNR